MKKTKIILVSAAFAAAISATGCDSSDYNKATELYNSGQYSDANAIFSELGDYKDSAQMLKNGEWKELCAYLSESKQKDGDDSWVFKLYSENDQIIYEADMSMEIANMHYKVTFTQESETAAIEGSMYFKLGSAWSNNTADGKWDIKSYTGGEIQFENYSAEGVQITGEPVTDPALTYINPEQEDKFIIEGIRSTLDGSKYTLKDLGFESLGE